MKVSKTNQYSYILKLKKAIICLILVIPPSFFISCSEDDGEPEPFQEPSYTSPASVRIRSNVANVPSTGIITAQYTDAPLGSDISKILDGDIHTKIHHFL